MIKLGEPFIIEFEPKDVYSCSKILRICYDDMRESKNSLWSYIPDEIVDRILLSRSDEKEILKLNRTIRDYWIARIDTNVVGMIGLDRVIDNKYNGHRIANLAVHPDYRGRGIGRKLMNYLIEQAKNRNIKKLLISTPLPKHDAIEAMGLTHIPEHDRYFPDVKPPPGFNEKWKCKHMSQLRIDAKIDQYYFELFI